MDKKEPGKDVSDAVTRESLIAISYTEPEDDIALGHSPKDLKSENAVDGTIGDGDEKYRSKLISISFQLSPDIKALPIQPEEFKG